MSRDADKWAITDFHKEPIAAIFREKHFGVLGLFGPEDESIILLRNFDKNEYLSFDMEWHPRRLQYLVIIVFNEKTYFAFRTIKYLFLKRETDWTS